MSRDVRRGCVKFTAQLFVWGARENIGGRGRRRRRSEARRNGPGLVCCSPSYSVPLEQNSTGSSTWLQGRSSTTTQGSALCAVCSGLQVFSSWEPSSQPNTGCRGCRSKPRRAPREQPRLGALEAVLSISPCRQGSRSRWGSSVL